MITKLIEIRSHLGVHDPEKASRYKCNFKDCTYASRYPKDVRRHQLIHKPKPLDEFVCTEPGCTKTFFRKDNLLRHLHKHNTSTSLHGTSQTAHGAAQDSHTTSVNITEFDEARRFIAQNSLDSLPLDRDYDGGNNDGHGPSVKNFSVSPEDFENIEMSSTDDHLLKGQKVVDAPKIMGQGRQLSAQVGATVSPLLVPGTYTTKWEVENSNRAEFGAFADKTKDVNTLGLAEPEHPDTEGIAHTAAAVTDSGYGTGETGTKFDNSSVIGQDTDSVTTDESHVPILGRDKYLLEAVFAHEICKRFNLLMREHFMLRNELTSELLYTFSVIIGKRASSAAQRHAASFVRRGRK